jgi:hypothetical protein
MLQIRRLVLTGTLAATEAADTATAAGLVRWVATLAAIEAPDAAASWRQWALGTLPRLTDQAVFIRAFFHRAT